MKPKLTVGVVSCNRKFYLKALINSLKKTIDQDINLIVVDNASNEPGLRDFLKNEKFINKLILNENRNPSIEHINALNQIVENVETEFLLILSDDIQFVRKNWIKESLFVLNKYPEIDSVSLSALRRLTLKNIFEFNIQHIINILRDIFFRKKIRFQKKFYSINEKFISFGYMREPIDGVGMLTICRTNLWKKLYPWKNNIFDKIELKDSSGGGEYYMIKKARRQNINGHMITSNIPVIATIITDRIGFNAKVRNNFRYGNYFAAKDDLYYYINDNFFNNKFIPLSLEEFIIPNNFTLPVDKLGNLIKGSINNHKKEQI